MKCYVRNCTVHHLFQKPHDRTAYESWEESPSFFVAYVLWLVQVHKPGVQHQMDRLRTPTAMYSSIANYFCWFMISFHTLDVVVFISDTANMQKQHKCSHASGVRWAIHVLSGSVLFWKTFYSQRKVDSRTTIALNCTTCCTLQPLYYTFFYYDSSLLTLRKRYITQRSPKKFSANQHQYFWPIEIVWSGSL